ncbi:Ran-binding-domain-containing protein [Neoconidiobolus thromboides FSU 785]|nr:Ran-binding-domain-containing protein [Neoconidiobolus thromboides FSU 785]
MDELLAKLSGQAVSLVGKAAFGLVTKVAMAQITKYIDASTKKESFELKILKKEFEFRLNIISPAIELIEVGISRGNSSLEAVIEMTDSLRQDIEQFNSKFNSDPIKSNDTNHNDAELIIKELKKLVGKLDSTVSYIQLVLSITNVDLNSKLPKGISASRLLQASSLLTCVAQMNQSGLKVVKVGKEIQFTVYSLFSASSRPKGKEDFTWKEEYALCQGWIERKFHQDGIIYEVVLEEDFDDGRVHEDATPGEKRILVEKIRSMYYSSSGKLLNIEDITEPVLVLKVANEEKDKKDTQWLALAINNYNNDESDEETDEKKDKTETDKREELLIKNKEPKAGLNQLEILNQLIVSSGYKSKQNLPISALSLFEYILRLAGAEVSQQKSHLLISDEMLARYLQDSYINKDK